MKFSRLTGAIGKTYKRLKLNCRTFTNTPAKPIILGIESSCDDTGAAIVSADRKILGEELISQNEVVLRHGGILPLIARDLHQDHIHSVVENTFKKANMTINDIDAIAVTVKPGLAMSLAIGIQYAKELCVNNNKLLIPIHHMEAHALTIRLCNEDVKFPFLTFLISGGHCLLAIAHSVDKFSLLGQSLDDAPGEAFDKIARRLKIHNLSKYRSSSGGAVIEDLAKTGDPEAFNFTEPLQKHRNCNFSFSGLKTQSLKFIKAEESKFEIEPDGVIPSVTNFCASFQLAIARHLCRRLQRAMEYIEFDNLLPDDNRVLVVSGGVASNNYLRKAFEIVCAEKGYTLCIPPAKYCTDNGIMIAWNGVERYVNNLGLPAPNEIPNIRGEPRCPLGENLEESVEKANIKCTWIKIAKKLHENVS